MKKFGALILAGGSGRRMQSEIHKQFLPIDGKPMFLLSTEAFLSAGCETVVVSSREDRENVISELLKAGYPVVSEGRTYEEEKTGDSDGKLTGDLQGSAGSQAENVQGKPFVHVCTGGSERWQSSYNGLRYLLTIGGCDYVLIHDAARPFVTREIIERAKENAVRYGAAAAAVVSKDTVKIADAEGFVLSTPDRSRVYLIQTPQAFSFKLILGAYEKLLETEAPASFGITDDAGCAELFSGQKVRLFEGSYGNMKITTPEDYRTLQTTS